jgi:CRP-like cAMP-binding protein
VQLKLESIPPRVPIVSIHTGGHFGEFALKNESRRQASVVCLSDSHLLTVNKTEFNELMAKILKKNEEKMIEFWRGIPYLKNLGSHLASKLQYHLQLVTYDRKGTIVLKEDEPSLFVVFLVEGEFQIVKEKIAEDDAQILDFLEGKESENQHIAKKVQTLRGS